MPFFSRKRSRLLRWLAVPWIFGFPIAYTAWRSEYRVDSESTLIARLSARGQSEKASLPAVRNVRDYLARRNAAVDRLLPAGEGGIVFVERLGGNAGVALPGSAVIGIASEGLSSEDAEYVELHERAHLLHANLPDEVARLLSRLPGPAPDEYAARNPAEHFLPPTQQRPLLADVENHVWIRVIPTRPDLAYVIWDVVLIEENGQTRCGCNARGL